MEENTNTLSPQEEKEARSGKIFFLVFGLIIAGSVFATYYRIMIQKNYVIEAQVDCDPTEKACFVWQCNPESDVPGEACTGDPEADIWYYNIVKRNASNIPLCDPATDETCTPMVCEIGEEDCEEILCNEENKIEQAAECNDPEQYIIANPPEEESFLDEAACAEGDLECKTDNLEDLPTTETDLIDQGLSADMVGTECLPDDPKCQTATIQTDSAGPNTNQPAIPPVE